MTITNEVTGFVRDVAERGVKTAAQAAVLQIAAQGGTDALHSSAFNLNWVALAGFALGGFVLSVLTSLASQPVGDGATASLLKSVGVLSLPAAEPATVPAPAAPVYEPGLVSAVNVLPRVVAPAETVVVPPAPSVAPLSPAVLAGPVL